ncbi:unnamed protein product [Mucor hiemalis]
MYTSNPIMTGYQIEQPQMMNHCNITPFDEQELLLTSGFYPITEELISSYPPMSDYTSSSSSSSPDIMACQYNYFSSPSPSYSTVESTANFDFFPFLGECVTDNRLTSPIITTPQQQQQDPKPTPQLETITKVESRPYPCHMCKRAFARKHDLQRHIRVHTGDKPYQCPCCKKSFARTDALKRHLRMEEHCRSSEQVQTMKSLGRRKFKNLELRKLL